MDMYKGLVPNLYFLLSCYLYPLIVGRHSKKIVHFVIKAQNLVYVFINVL